MITPNNFVTDKNSTNFIHIKKIMKVVKYLIICISGFDSPIPSAFLIYS